MLTTKPGVRFAIITPALVHMLGAVERLSRAMFALPKEGLVITAGSDGRHAPTSKHYKGEAIDVRSKAMSVQTRNSLMSNLRVELGPQFTVLLEDEGLPNEHIHVQVRKGRRFEG